MTTEFADPPGQLPEPLAGIPVAGGSLADEVLALWEARPRGRPELVAFYAGRILESLTASALGRSGADVAGNLFSGIERLRTRRLMDKVTAHMCHHVRRCANDARHAFRALAPGESDEIMAFVRLYLTWYQERVLLQRGPHAGLEKGSWSSMDSAVAILFRPHRPEQLRNYLREHWTKIANTPALANAYGRRLIDIDQLEIAAELMDAVPTDANGWLLELRGLWLSRARRYDEAIACLSQAVARPGADLTASGRLAGALKRRWLSGGPDAEDLRRSFELYTQAWRRSEGTSSYLAINVAATALWLGKADVAREHAQAALDLVRPDLARHACDSDRHVGDMFYEQVTAAEALLLLGQADAAAELFRVAGESHGSETAPWGIVIEQVEQHVRVLALAEDVAHFISVQRRG